MLKKLTLLAGAAGVLLSGLAINAGPAMAQQGRVCLNPYAGVVPLSHDDMVPNEGFRYDKSFVDSQLARGNRCPDSGASGGTTQQSAPFIPYNQRVPQAQRNKTMRSYY